MKPDLSGNDLLILQTMWQLKALGSRSVAIQDLTARLPDLASGVLEMLRDLEARGLVTASREGGPDRFALSLLGAACVRELQEEQLVDLSRIS